MKTFKSSSCQPWGTNLIHWLDSHYLFILTVFVLLVYGMTYSAKPFGDPIQSDGAGYYAYLPSFVLYGDPSYERVASEQYDGAIPAWTYVRRYPPTERYLNSLNLGVSLMTLPFFGVAHLLTIWFGFPWEGGFEFFQMRFPPDGYSFFYQHSAGLAGVFYFLAGFALLKRFLSRHFSKGAVLACLTALLLGTNLLYYGAVWTVNAHPFTFFLAVAMIYLTDNFYRSPRNIWTSVGLGSVAVLLYLVRPLNPLMLLWIPFYAIHTWSDVALRIQLLWQSRKNILLMGAIALVWMVPQLLIWKYSSGHFIVYAYRHIDQSHFGVPDIVELVIGIKKGMLTWFPLFLFAYLGFWPAFKDRRAAAWPALVLMIAYPLVTGSYQDWWTAGGFGNRYLVDMVPFAAFPLAALFGNLKTTWTRTVVALLTVACLFWAVFLLTLLYRREIGYYGLDGQAIFDIFYWRKHAIQAFLGF